jgi:hypothetical protein
MTYTGSISYQYAVTNALRKTTPRPIDIQIYIGHEFATPLSISIHRDGRNLVVGQHPYYT